jgi:hypothetical protein
MSGTPVMVTLSVVESLLVFVSLPPETFAVVIKLGAAVEAIVTAIVIGA